MLNRIEIMGKLVADPEVKTASNGDSLCTFRIACERDYAPNGARKETDFIDCFAWREKADFICKSFTKGMPIVVLGRLQMRKWEDRDGKRRVSAEIQVDSSYFAGGEKKNVQNTEVDTNGNSENGGFNDIWDPNEGDLPF